MICKAPGLLPNRNKQKKILNISQVIQGSIVKTRFRYTLELAVYTPPVTKRLSTRQPLTYSVVPCVYLVIQLPGILHILMLQKVAEIER